MGKPEVICFIGRDSPLVRFSVRHVLHRMLGWDIRIVTDPEIVGSPGVPAICYDNDPIDGCFHLKPVDVDLDAPLSGERPLDVFDAAGKLLTLPESHMAMGSDEHGRPRTKDLVCVKQGWLHRPILDEWVLAFANVLREGLPGLPPVRRKYRHIATMDVDNGFMFLGRPLWRTIGAGAREVLRGDLARFSDRVRTLSGRQRDPYDVYDDFHRATAGHADRVIVNFLVAPRGGYDHAVGPDDRLMRQRMQQVATWADIGLHPSYESSDRMELFEQERNALQEAINRPVTTSRQHFLRMRLPSTYNELERIGIREDHSIGLSDAIGFRAGTCTPFPYFDPIAQRETELLLNPFMVMDSAMAYKMKLGPDRAIEAGRALIDAVKRVEGTFIGVWHERFLSDYGPEKGWRRVLEETIRYARP